MHADDVSSTAGHAEDEDEEIGHPLSRKGSADAEMWLHQLDAILTTNKRESSSAAAMRMARLSDNHDSPMMQEFADEDVEDLSGSWVRPMSAGTFDNTDDVTVFDDDDAQLDEVLNASYNVTSGWRKPSFCQHLGSTLDLSLGDDEQEEQGERETERPGQVYRFSGRLSRDSDLNTPSVATDGTLQDQRDVMSADDFDDDADTGRLPGTTLSDACSLVLSFIYMFCLLSLSFPLLSLLIFISSSLFLSLSFVPSISRARASEECSPEPEHSHAPQACPAYIVPFPALVCRLC